MFTRAVADENNYRRGEISCLLSPFGSYGLGGYIRNADIDIVLICPQMVKRRDFFRFFPNTLKQLATIRDIEVSHLDVSKNKQLLILDFLGNSKC